MVVAEAVAIAVEAEAEAVPIVVEVAAAHTVVVVVAEVHMAVEGPALTADTNLFLKFKGPAERFGRAFCFSRSAHAEILSRLQFHAFEYSRVTCTQLFPPAGVR